MTYLLFRLWNLEKFDLEASVPTRLGIESTPRFVDQFPTEDEAKAKIKQVVQVEPPAEPLGPTNRFAIYKPKGDQDGDGFWDGFTFSEPYNANVPDKTPTVRKVKRAK